MRALITTQPRSREGDHPVPVSPKFVGEEEGAGEERILIKRQLTLTECSGNSSEKPTERDVSSRDLM